MKKPRSSIFNAILKSKVREMVKKNKLIKLLSNKNQDFEESSRWLSLHYSREFREIGMSNSNIDRLTHKD